MIRKVLFNCFIWLGTLYLISSGVGLAIFGFDWLCATLSLSFGITRVITLGTIMGIGLFIGLCVGTHEYLKKEKKQNEDY
ncbi:MAG: hypothetical protein RR335_10205, partial [Eubacterium sp.]